MTDTKLLNSHGARVGPLGFTKSIQSTKSFNAVLRKHAHNEACNSWVVTYSTKRSWTPYYISKMRCTPSLTGSEWVASNTQTQNKSDQFHLKYAATFFVEHKAPNHKSPVEFPLQQLHREQRYDWGMTGQNSLGDIYSQINAVICTAVTKLVVSSWLNIIPYPVKHLES